MEPERPCKHPCGVSAAPGMPMLLYLGPPGARELGVRPKFESCLHSLLAVWLWMSHINLPGTHPVLYL